MHHVKKVALLAGASGLVGGHCLQFLLEDDAYEAVVILARKEIPLRHPKLQQHILHFDRLQEYAPIIKADDIFCCLGTTIKKAGSRSNFRKVDYTYPLQIARMALANGAGQFLVVTATAANKSSLIFYNRVKGQVEEAVKILPYQAVHIFRPSLLLGKRPEYRPGEKIGAVLFNMTAPLFIGPLKRYKAIEGRAVAGAMVACAKKNGKGVFVYESEEIQKIFSSMLG